jgi:hypothetical protein
MHLRIAKKQRTIQKVTHINKTLSSRLFNAIQNVVSTGFEAVSLGQVTF